MKKKRKDMIGRVVSNKMDKTVMVKVERRQRHLLYRKTIRKTTNFKAHDENNDCGLGDIVRIMETRPLSRDKRWRVVEIKSKGEVAEVQPKEIA